MKNENLIVFLFSRFVECVCVIISNIVTLSVRKTLKNETKTRQDSLPSNPIKKDLL